MSTLANITSLNLSLQTGGAALAVKSAGRLVAPARTVFVYGTADDVAPNFTTVAGAITYANSLTPIVTEPVVVRLFTKADGTPYTLAGLSSWTTYANQYIYFVSDFVRLNETTTLPTTLPVGLQVWYIDANGVETLWVGREDGSAWPAVGYKELRFIGFYSSFDSEASISLVEKNEIGASLSISDITATGYSVSIGIDRTGPYNTGGIATNLDSGSAVIFQYIPATNNKVQLIFPVDFEGPHTVAIQIYP
jgi:hypothetical protein